MTPTRNKATPELGAHGAILVAFAHARRWSPGTVPARSETSSPTRRDTRFALIGLTTGRGPRRAQWTQPSKPVFAKCEADAK